MGSTLPQETQKGQHRLFPVLTENDPVLFVSKNTSFFVRVGSIFSNADNLNNTDTPLTRSEAERIKLAVEREELKWPS